MQSILDIWERNDKAKKTMNQSAEFKLAKSLWGDVNRRTLTTREGAYWFDCSGHGGYIVKTSSLTSSEKYRLKERGYIAHKGFYDFEEDCNYKDLEECTDIRTR